VIEGVGLNFETVGTGVGPSVVDDAEETDAGDVAGTGVGGSDNS